jgi:hypothetical protein
LLGGVKLVLLTLFEYEKGPQNRGPFLLQAVVSWNLEHVLHRELNQPRVHRQGVDYPEA